MSKCGIAWVYGMMCICVGCTWESLSDKRVRVIGEAIAQRVDSYLVTKRNQCQTRMMEEANKRVDSILIAEAQASLLEDSLVLLQYPRPESPPDTLPRPKQSIDPILTEDSLRSGSDSLHQ